MKCLCASTRHAARLLTRMYDEELRPANLTPAQFELLATLSARPKLPQSELANALALDQTTLSRNLKLLLGRKWVERTAPTHDRRRVAYQLTDEGLNAWHCALPHWKRAQDRMREALGSEWETVWSTLELLTRAV